MKEFFQFSFEIHRSRKFQAKALGSTSFNSHLRFICRVKLRGDEKVE